MGRLRKLLAGRMTSGRGSAEGVPRYVHPDTVIGHEHRFVWYCIPKNASRSILRALTDGGRGQRIALLGAAGRRARLLSQPRPAFAFAFVRDPFARIASAWMNKIESPPDTPAQARLFAMNAGLCAGMSLDDFVEWVRQDLRSVGRVDPHWRPQADFVTDATGRLCVDFLGRLEALDDDFAAVESRIGPVEGMRHRNRSRIENDPARLLSPRAAAIVREVYARDFEVLGYATQPLDAAARERAEPMMVGTAEARDAPAGSASLRRPGTAR
jgi:hypothetical protein